MIKINKQQLAMALNKGYYNTSLTPDDRMEIYECFKYTISPTGEDLETKICKKIQKMKPPIVVLHSGGVDSTFMLLMAIKCFESGDINVISIGQDEKRISGEICHHLGIKHDSYLIGEQAVSKTLNQINENTYQDLFFSSSLVPTFIAMDKTEYYSNYILTGDGGDELFCGYDRYLVYKYLRWVPEFMKVLTRDTRRGNKLKNFFEYGYEGMVEIFTEKEIWKMIGIIAFPNVVNIWFGHMHYDSFSSLEKCMYFDIMTELFGLETKKVETAARMAGNPKITSPFLDMDVLKYCCGLPIEYKYRWGTRKWLLRKIISKDIPWYNTISKKKKGFAFPLLEQIGKMEIEKTKLNSNYVQGNRFDTRKIIDKNSEKLWTLLILDYLMKKGILELEL